MPLTYCPPDPPAGSPPPTWNAAHDYIPAPFEAERQVAMPRCAATVMQVYIKGVLHVTDGHPDARCPACGGRHAIVDEFATGEQLQKAMVGRRTDTAVMVRKDGLVDFVVIGKGLPAADVNYGPYYVTKDIGNNDPRIIQKG